jgi:tetratricopeptide (TPR) repeat protein
VNSVKKREIFLVWLALWGLAQAVSAQDKNLALLDEYSMLSGHIEKAKTAFHRDNLAKSEQEVLFCLERLPEHHEAHFLLSQILYKRGEFEKALEHIQAAKEGYLKYTEAVSLLGQQKSEKQMDNVVDLTDDVQGATAAEDAARSRGTCQISRYDKAVRDAKEKLSNEQKLKDTDESKKILTIPANYHYCHGNCLFRLKRLAEAEADYLLVLKIDPRYREAYNNLINLLFLQKRLDEARAFLSQAEAHKAAISPGLKKAVLETSQK